jgi:hypothetical protein
MKLLIESTDLELKGDIAAYFSNYLYNNLKGETSEKRYFQLEKYYNLITNVEFNELIE